MSSWFPKQLPKGWKFAANTTGWTNNFHGLKWIEHFDNATKSQLQSPYDYRLLVCDGHDSHISADFVAYCIHHRIDLILLPPHSSHLLQPLDVGVFSPLKRAVSTQISRFIRNGVTRIQKVEWLEKFIEARGHGITKENIISGWRGVGLFPENMHRILVQLADYEKPSTPLASPQNCTTHPTFYPNSCRPDPTSIHAINQAFLAEIHNTDLSTSCKTQVRRLCNFIEEYYAEAAMLKKELHEVKEINGHRKERETQKRWFLKDKAVLSTEEVEKALREMENATKKKKVNKKGTAKPVVSPEEVTDSSTEDSSDIEEEIFDCIEVAKQKSNNLIIDISLRTTSHYIPTDSKPWSSAPKSDL